MREAIADGGAVHARVAQRLDPAVVRRLRRARRPRARSGAAYCTARRTGAERARVPGTAREVMERGDGERGTPQIAPPPRRPCGGDANEAVGRVPDAAPAGAAGPVARAARQVHPDDAIGRQAERRVPPRQRGAEHRHERACRRRPPNASAPCRRSAAAGTARGCPRGSRGRTCHRAAASARRQRRGASRPRPRLRRSPGPPVSTTGRPSRARAGRRPRQSVPPATA